MTELLPWVPWAVAVLAGLAAAFSWVSRARIRRELARELAQKERYHRRLQLLDLAIQRMSLGLTITDPSGAIVYVNPADAAMHGYLPDELIGRSSRIFGAGDAGGPVCPPPEAPAFWCRETLNRAKDGRVFPVRLISDTVPGEDGRPRALVTLCEDISEMWRMQEERRRVAHMKQDFLCTVSHELRTPLTSLLGALDLVRSSRLSPDRIQELLGIAERNGSRLLSLVNDLLDLQRLEAGELRFQVATVELGQVLEEAVRDVQGFADRRNVRVRTETDLPATGLVTDGDRLSQVLYNLLSNAIKFSPSGEEVLLAARPDGGEVEFRVCDRGPGITEEFRGRLFETFAQAEGSQTRRQGGSGLGLSMSKKLVEGLGGTIAIASSPGAGTTATVRVPRHALARPA
jgi:signal transduction histidine kinase